ncbi:NAD-dependent epimerase/dehydratase family protein [Chengkuizengella sediminis]|uniref:NAD-dependent epimerase/dehydratase family protein n=1 Tax=Chengkuizengella sediminis TaxID=1885917 RepID=UPI00138A5F48|nr:NAD-dependent epimerase/dehydratase family protein [Chengkuizengella sediminis]NDI35462.1 NAD-dependent epimerase/dehydratase family protein [Chengkuizengella sediminis]
MKMKGKVIMKKVLVLGGTRFFGKQLVNLLLENDYDVSIATRGLSSDPFGNRVHRFIIDRTDPDSLNKLSSKNWDIVYDNICYSPNDALHAVKAFKGSIKKYIFISSRAVYDAISDKPTFKEEDFDPFNYPINYGNRHDFSYDEGKRLAEAVLYQKADFSVTAVRFPIVLGNEDYTKRLEFHIDRISNGQEIGVKDQKALMSFISDEDASIFLYWLAEHSIEGPVNAASDGEINLTRLLSIIGKKVQKEVLTTTEINNNNLSPFALNHSFLIDTSKAVKHGFQFSNIHEWLPELIT